MALLQLKELPISERPVERLWRLESPALSTGELLEILVGDADATVGQRILVHFGGLWKLSRAGLTDLVGIKGIGPARAARIKAAFALGRRLAAAAPEGRPIVRSPQDAADLVVDMRTLVQEEMRVILLDSRNRVVRIPTIYIGNVNTIAARTSELFRAAIAYNCPAIIVVHNHVSGDPTPSRQDVRATKAIVQAGELLDIEVLDHLIIGTSPCYISLRERAGI